MATDFRCTCGSETCIDWAACEKREREQEQVIQNLRNLVDAHEQINAEFLRVQPVFVGAPQVVGVTRTTEHEPGLNDAVFNGGATRSHVAPRYDLIPGAALRRLALRYTMGAAIHGDTNWQRGGNDFFRDVPNHMMEHLYKWLGGDRSEDHLAAVAWGAFALMWMEETHGERASQQEK